MSYLSTGNIREMTIPEVIADIQADQSWVGPYYPGPGETPALAQLARCRTWAELRACISEHWPRSGYEKLGQVGD